MSKFFSVIIVIVILLHKIKNFFESLVVLKLYFLRCLQNKEPQKNVLLIKIGILGKQIQLFVVDCSAQFCSLI